MAQQMRPSSREDAPDPSHSYERSHPHREAGMGRLDSNKATPTKRRDKMQEGVPNKSDPTRQINAEETIKAGERRKPRRNRV